MLTLGISGNLSSERSDLVPDMPANFCHDASACLVRDGEVLAVIEEERLNRIKKTTKFPVHAIRWCLRDANVSPGDIDAVGYYLPEYFIDRALNHHYFASPQTPRRYSRQLIKERLRESLDWDLPDEMLTYVPHHVSHALPAMAGSGMSEALAVVMDGMGEYVSATVFHARQGELRELASYPSRDSLGQLYFLATSFLGYGVGDEYKVMGLAPYGNPARFRKAFSKLYTLLEDGQYQLHLQDSGILTGNLVERMFFEDEGLFPRQKGEPFAETYCDFAAALQETLEKISLHIMAHWSKLTGIRNLCFSGGVAHNSTLNGLILRSGLFDRVFIPPAAHDGGAGEGAALAVDGEFRKNSRPRRQLRSACLGPSLGGTEEIVATLDLWSSVLAYERRQDIVGHGARLLADGAVLGWATGRSEYGPRALGNRSILADPRPKENRDRINAMIKQREGYRPFAPVVTRAAAATYFEIPDTVANYEFMSFVLPVREEQKEHLGAVTHVDGTARVQVVDEEANERFSRLVARFGEITGTPVLLNTSFNNSFEPIVQSVEDVLTAFLTTELDYLVIEDFVVRRRERSMDLSEFVPEFRPTTRIGTVVDPAAGAARHEIYADYTGGPRHEVSADLHDLLGRADGHRTLRDLAAAAVSSDGGIGAEVHQLWRKRLITLRPLSGK
ncbi:carbamoyltransferase family protein [Amycolatopsis nigrescens]|uniref:carbamoyltransferase family protein n=1 Tax=Amycolatopsis nigrescens TaxID=381445 RepID=UPI0003788758|nr:carbamoyltransferase C-terminal domain-containing protein [Amycolatopsis nigrescens]